MDVILIASVGLLVWLSILVVAVAICRAASHADGHVDVSAGVSRMPRAEARLGRRAGAPVV